MDVDADRVANDRIGICSVGVMGWKVKSSWLGLVDIDPYPVVDDELELMDSLDLIQTPSPQVDAERMEPFLASLEMYCVGLDEVVDLMLP